jgi:SAM-dependent methyltransferase
MFEKTGADLKVDALMHEIREAVARHQRDGTLTSPASNGNQHSTGSFSLQPTFEPNIKLQYHVNDLLRFHGADFVRNSYRALLLREPNEMEMSQHLAALATGRFNKIDVLASMHSSSEGRQTKVKMSGLAMPSTFRRLGRVPLIGYVVRLITAVARLPLTLKHQNRFEFYLGSQLQRVVDHQNQFQRDTRDQLTRISEQLSEAAQSATEQQQALDSCVEEYERLFEQQTKLRSVVEEGLASSRSFDESSTKLIEQLDSETRQLLDQLQAIARQQGNLMTSTEHIKSEVQNLGLHQQQTSGAISTQQKRVDLLLEQIRRNNPRSEDSFTKFATAEADHLLDGLYAAFEDQFRGDFNDVRRRLEVYVPFLKGAQISEGALDVGCGRGEWLQLLKSEGIECEGVDRNRVFIEYCRTAGLNVVEADASEYLRSLPSDSLRCITSFHLVEHLPFVYLVNLLDEVFRILKPNGLVILETPNPENFMVGSCNFYADPTHRNPIPNQTLQFLLESRGFETIDVLKLRPWDEAKLEGDSELVRRFNEYFYSAPDYGIVAKKPTSSV